MPDVVSGGCDITDPLPGSALGLVRCGTGRAGDSGASFEPGRAGFECVGAAVAVWQAQLLPAVSISVSVLI